MHYKRPTGLGIAPDFFRFEETGEIELHQQTITHDLEISEDDRVSLRFLNPNSSGAEASDLVLDMYHNRKSIDSVPARRLHVYLFPLDPEAGYFTVEDPADKDKKTTYAAPEYVLNCLGVLGVSQTHVIM